jgi:hypothetical protein
MGLMVSGAAGGGSAISGTAGGAGILGAVGAGPKASTALALATLARIRRESPAAFTGVTQSQVTPCTTGDITISATVADGTGATTSVGDGYQISFNNCTDSLGGRMTGTLGFTITATDGALFMDSPPVMNAGTTYSMAITYGAFAMVDSMGSFTGIDGNMTVSMLYASGTGWRTETITGSSIVFAAGSNGNITSSFEMAGPTAGGQYSILGGEHYPSGLTSFPDAQASGFTARLCSTEMAGCLKVVTNPALEVWDPDLYPSKGTMTFTDDAGRYITLTATNGVTGAVTVTYNIGAGVVGPKATTWSCLDQADSSACF